MASKALILSLLLVSLIGLVSAATPVASTPSAAASNASAPAADDAIGNADDAAAGGAPGAAASEVVAGPLGSAASTNQSPSAESPTSGASALHVSAIAGVAAVAGFMF